MYFKIHFDKPVSSGLYKDYCDFIFESVKKSIERSVEKSTDREKYKVREPFILESSVMKWVVELDHIDLVYYVTHCLEMVREKGEYVIRVSQSQKVYGSLMKVSTLIKLLEYGNEKLPPLPLIRTVFRYYEENYRYLLPEFLERRMTNERVSVRRGSR